MRPSDENTSGSAHEIRSVLLLDDDVELASTLKKLLEFRNFVVTTVTNGVEGLREVMEMDFDVILCDLMMPHMPGDMFFLAVQRSKPHLCSRFIFITAHSGIPHIEEFLAKADGLVLRKPFPTDELIKAISFVLNETDKDKQATN